jgi:hypothetical protein
MVEASRNSPLSESKIMTRLNILKQYLAEAKQDEDNNKLYIEDLLLSIEMEKTLPAYKEGSIILNASLD